LANANESLLKATVRRIQPLVGLDQTLIVTSAALEAQVRAELPDLPAENILAEPVGRNTAACIGWAAAHVRRVAPDSLLMVLPADHHIADEPAFLEAARTALEAAQLGDLTTLGVRPTRPETGYGYIEIGEELAPHIHRARRFVEKPNRRRAEQLWASGNFLWNSGMFFFQTRAVLESIHKHLPSLGLALDRFDAAARAGQEEEAVQHEYSALPSISIDHGLMEKATNVAVVPASFGWSDLGGWQSAWELAPKDAHGNAMTEGTVAVESQNCYVHTTGERLVALVGVQDMVVVDTGDALLIVPRDRCQQVREVVEKLKAARDTKYL